MPASAPAHMGGLPCPQADSRRKLNGCPVPGWTSTSATPGSAETVDRLSPDGRASEYLMFALRLREGASLSRYAELAGTTLPETALNEVIELGLAPMTAT
jgi:hypothetical protein